MLIKMLIMVGELGRFSWTMLTVLVMSHHYFHADIVDWKITTVITVKMLAFDVESLQVRINDEGPVSKDSDTRCNFSCNLQRNSTLGRCKIGKYKFPLQVANIF